jgi:probable F420-dependent oxidoreductase
VRLGINVANFGPATGPEAFDRWAALGEDLGFDMLAMSDHVLVTPDVAANYPAPFYDALTTLAYLAGTTNRIRLGTTVLVLPYRHPLLVARVAATLDQLSRGRLVLGVGAGWAAREFATLGLDHARRGPVTDEHLRVLLEAWSTPVLPDGTATGPAPAQRPRPPVWVGGGGDGRAGMRRAVRFGATWHPLHPSLADVRDRHLPELRRLAEGAGTPVPAVAPRLALRLLDGTAPGGDDRPLGTGTLDQVRTDVEALGHLGIEDVMLDPYVAGPEGPDHDAAARQVELVGVAVLSR